MKWQKNVTERRFKCPVCKTIQVAYKSSAHRTAEGHIKTMWCYWCKAERQFMQYKYDITL